MDHVSKFEIPVDDIDRAERFYSTLFQWSIHRNGKHYHAVTAPSDNRGVPVIMGTINGTLVLRRDEDYPLIVIRVDSIEETLRMAETIGGKIILPMHQRGDEGFFAKIIDTEGNIIELWEDMRVNY